ncbi:cell division protein CrgA [Leekyejoonella antrihumi]|uniref:Cell division protein CrgA n=1 Tax=Leekyejoonella antrihumi TaxID=1660198 RepID=A0A563E712_9MICO|nr:cell division protein CrgA [Leekyejoonella antrihumi]
MGSAKETSKDSATSTTDKGGVKKPADKKTKSGTSRAPGRADTTATSSASRRRTPQRQKPQKIKSDELNPVWWVPTMVTLMVVGLIWLVVCYLTQTDYPIPGISSWNLVVGFAAIMVGFLMTTRWR